jgi:hypothetical protein
MRVRLLAYAVAALRLHRHACAPIRRTGRTARAAADAHATNDAQRALFGRSRAAQRGSTGSTCKRTAASRTGRNAPYTRYGRFASPLIRR